MKSFKEYLTESKKTYEFKIKIAGECPKDCGSKIKEALSTYKVESCSSGKGLPIAETYIDFPGHKNIGVTVYDVTVSYPATAYQVRSAVIEALGCSGDTVKVRNMKEEEEDRINHEHDNKSGESLLGKDYENSDNQDKVGTKHVMSLLKDLNNVKSSGEQYKGVNDSILAKSVPTEKAPTVSDKIGNTSPLGKIKNTDPRKGR